MGLWGREQPLSTVLPWAGCLHSKATRAKKDIKTFTKVFFFYTLTLHQKNTFSDAGQLGSLKL